MIYIVRIERWALTVVFLCTLIPIAARSESFGLPLYGIPLMGLYFLWCWRSLPERCLNSQRAVRLIPFVFVAFLLGLSTFLAENAEPSGYWVWVAGLLMMVYANQNWKVTFGFQFLARLAILLLSIELLVALLQIVTRSYVGNAVMYFGDTGGVAEEVGLIAGGRVFRPVGTFGLPNLLSIFILIASAFLIPVAAGTRGFTRGMRIYSVLLLAIGLGVLVYSTSRGNIIGLLALPLLFLLLRTARMSRMAVSARNWGSYFLWGSIGFFVLALVLALVAYRFGDAEFLEGLLYRLEGVRESAQFRFLQYCTSIGALAEFPIFGMGHGQSALVWEIVELEFPGKEGFRFPPHNSYIVLALEAGLLAGLLYAATLAWLGLSYPLRQISGRPTSSPCGNIRMDGVYLSFLMFALASLIYIVPLMRSLWPLGCFLIGVMQALPLSGPPGKQRVPD